MTAVPRRRKSPGQNGNQVLEKQDGVSPEGEPRHLWIIHPFLIALIPILHILAANPGQARFSDALKPMLISLGFTVVAFVILGLVLKNWEASGLIVSFFLLLFFTPGYFIDILHRFPVVFLLRVLYIIFFVILAVGVFLLIWYRKRLLNLTHRTHMVILAIFLLGLVWLLTFVFLAGGSPMYLLFSAVCVILAIGVLILLKYKDHLRNPTRIVNVVAAVLIALVIVQLLMTGTSKSVATRTDDVGRAAASKDVAPRNPAELPDIYYIILDAYGSERLLRDHFGYDNSQFIRSLEDRGFYVADSRSNYDTTYTSLASSLNLKYINYLSAEVGRGSVDRGPLRHMIEDNSLMRFLKSRGYKSAFFGTTFSATSSNRYADISYSESWIRDEFMVTLLNSTVFRCFSPAFTTRKSVLSTFENVPLIRKSVKGPLFVFAHIPSPHFPYLFDRNGKPLKQTDDEKAMYVEQMKFVNKKVIEMVDQTNASSDQKPVIVVHGDHGPSLDKNNQTAYETENLNALLVPSGDNLFYRSITPVNSFRIILNSIFDTHFSLLKDKTYESSVDRPYSFKELKKPLDGEQ